MASPIILNFNGKKASFDHKKLDRSKLYGKRLRIPLDSQEKNCERAELTEDGELLIRSGMTAQAYFDEAGNWVAHNQLIGLQDGKPLEKVPSTLGQEVDLEEASPEALLDLKLQSVYMLSPLELNDDLKKMLGEGKIFQFIFNYRADYHAETGFLLENENGFFALIGNPMETPWLELGQKMEVSEDEEEDDLDFEMF
jgi:hypothetical protein